MPVVRHPATEALSAMLPPELCRVICQFAAPHAAPVIPVKYRLVRRPEYEQLQVGCVGYSGVLRSGEAPPCQHITEYSPVGSRRRVRETAIKSSWSRERARYGLDDRKGCLCWKFYLPTSLYEPVTAPGSCFACSDGRKCPYTHGPLPLHHLSTYQFPRPPGQLVAPYRGHVWVSQKCDIVDHVPFAQRHYQKWIWTVNDERHWIDESCELNQVPLEKGARIKTKVKRLMTL
jgi:hypothetical protein